MDKSLKHDFFFFCICPKTWNYKTLQRKKKKTSQHWSLKQFLDVTPEAQATNAINRQMGFHQLMCPCTNKWIKKNMEYTHNEIKKGRNSDICNNKNGPGGYYK